MEFSYYRSWSSEIKVCVYEVCVCCGVYGVYMVCVVCCVCVWYGVCMVCAVWCVLYGVCCVMCVWFGAVMYLAVDVLTHSLSIYHIMVALGTYTDKF